MCHLLNSKKLDIKGEYSNKKARHIKIQALPPALYIIAFILPLNTLIFVDLFSDAFSLQKKKIKYRPRHGRWPANE